MDNANPALATLDRTLLDDGADPPVEAMSKYEQRLLGGECTRCGCVLIEERKAAGESMCERCHEKVKANKRRSAQKSRASWKRKRLCGQCGKKRRAGGKLCPGCTVRFGVVPKQVVDHYVDREGDLSEDRWAARVETNRDGVTSGYLHRRYRGRGKRGRQPQSQLDEQDLADARRCIEEGWQGLLYYRSAEVQAMPRIQREDVRREALSLLRRGQRWLEDIVERNTPKSAKRQAPEDDE